MTPKRKILTSGELVRQGHTLLTRAILKDHKVSVASRGSNFYNANGFAHPYFIFELGAVAAQKDITQFQVVRDAWIKADCDRKHRGKNEIVIAHTPDEVDEDYIRVLDGGILHESFHSLYTAKELDVLATHRIIAKHYAPVPNFSERIKLLKDLWNVYEDSMIERRGVKSFGGALTSLNFTCGMVWDREAECRDQWEPLSHFICYLRDRVKSHLTNPPLDAYDPNIRAVVDSLFGDLVAAGQKTQTSHECFDLAFQTYMRFLQLDSQPSAEASNDSSEDSNDSSEEEDATSEESGDSKESGEGGASESPQDEAGEAESDTGGQPLEGDSDGKSEESTQSSGSESNEGAEDADEGAEGGEDSTGDSGGTADLADTIEELVNDLSDSELKTISDLADEMWSQLADIPSTVRPYDPSEDQVQVVGKADSDDVTTYGSMAAQVRRDTVAIRQKLLNYLRGERKVRRVQKLESGTRLGRNVSDIVTNRKPRPFQQKEMTPALNTAVSIVMDESSSMRKRLSAATYMLITFSELFRAAKIPFEVTGFTDSGSADQIHRHLLSGLPQDGANVEPWDLRRLFTREKPCRFRIFRTFDESMTRENLAKLVKVSAHGNTPLADGMDFAARRLLERTEERRLLIIITDGEQSASTCKTAAELVAITNSQVDLLQNCGVETLFVGYNSYDVTAYKNHITVNSTSEFAQKVNEYIYQQVQQPVRRTA